MVEAHARATTGPGKPFTQYVVERRELRPSDVLIDIAYSGVCHSDIHHARNDFGRTRYPLVPGHEIAGTVAAVGSAVAGFAVMAFSHSVSA